MDYGFPLSFYAVNGMYLFKVIESYKKVRIMHKVNKGNRTTPFGWRRSGVFIINFENFRFLF